MARKRKRAGVPKPPAQIQKTVDMTTGIVGLSVASSVGATLPGLPGTIVSGGMMPIAATSMLPMAAEYGSTKKRRRKK